MTDTRAHVPPQSSVLAELPEQAALSCAPDGHVTRCNEAFAKLYRGKRDSVVGVHVDELFHAEESGDGVLLRLADGSWLPVRVSRLSEDDGSLTRLLVSERVPAAVDRSWPGRLLRITKTAAFSYDPRGNATHWLADGYPVLGLMPGMFSTGFEAVLSLLHPDDLNRVRQAWEQHLASGERMQLLARCLTFDGGVGRLACVAERAEDGRSWGCVAEVSDYNPDGDREREQLRQAQEAADLERWHLDLSTGLITVTGPRSKQRFDVASVDQWVHPEDREGLHRQMDLLRGGQVTGPERCELRSADGARHVLTVSYPEFDDSGEVIAISGTAQDVTLLRALEGRIAEQRVELSGTSRRAEVGTWQFVTGSSVIRFSPELCELLGIEWAEEIDVEAAFSAVRKEERERAWQQFALANTDPEALSEAEFGVVLPDGSVRVLNWTAELGGQTADGQRRLFGTARDVTRLRELERELADHKVRAGWIEAVPDTASWSWEFGSEWLWVSGGLAELFGFADSEIPLELARQHLHPDDRERMRNMEGLVLDGVGFEQWFEFRALSEEGTWYHLQASGRYLDQDGPPRIVGVLRDVTRLRELEYGLSENQERLRGLSDHAEVGAWEWQLGAEYVLVHGVLRELLGTTESGVLGIDQLVELFGSSDSSQRHAFLEQWHSQPVGTVRYQELRLDTAEAESADDSANQAEADGRARLIESRMELIEREDGRRFVRGTCRDVSELRRLQDQVRRQTELLAELEQHAEIGYWEWRIGAETFICGGQVKEVLQADQQGVTTFESLYELVHPDDRAALGAVLEQLSLLGEAAPERHEMRIRYGEGYRSFESSMELFERENGERWVRGIVRDVSRMRELEEQLDGQRERLRELTDRPETAYFEWDPETGACEMSEELRNRMGWEPPGPRTIAEIFELAHPQDLERLSAAAWPWRTREAVGPERHEVRFAIGEEYRVFDVLLTWRTRADGTAVVHGAARDVTELRELERKVDEQRAQRRAIAKFGVAGVWSWDVGSPYVWISPELIEPLGVSGEYFDVEWLVREHVVPEEIDRLRKLVAAHQAVEPVEEMAFDVRLRDLEGNIRVYAVRMDRVHENDGRTVVHGVSRDVTELRVLERAVDEQRTQRSALTGFGDTGTWSWDTDSGYVWVSEELRLWTGMPEASMNLDALLLERVEGEDLGRLREMARRYQSPEPPELDSVELKVRDADGNARVHLVVPNRIEERDGRRIVHGTARDVTELRELERDLAENRARLQGIGLFDDLSAWHWFPDTDVAEFSADTAVRFGIPEHVESLRQLVTERVPEEQRGEVYADMVRYAAEKEPEPTRMRLRFAIADGTERVLELHAEAVEQDGRRVVYGTTRDVTERLELERAVEDYRTRLAGVQSLENIFSWRFEPETGVWECPDDIAELFGLTGPIDIPMLERFMEPERIERIATLWQRMLDGEETDSTGELETNSVDSNGRAHVMVHRYEILERDGRLVVYGTSRDITKQRESERGSAREGVLLELDHAPGIGAWSYVLGQDHVEASPGFRKLFGIAMDEELSLEQVLERIHEDDRPIVEREIAESVRSGQHTSEEFEFRIYGEDGTRLVRTYVTTVFEEDGRPRLVGSAYDLTEARELRHRSIDDEVHASGVGRVLNLGTWEWDTHSGHIVVSAEFRLTFFPNSTGQLTAQDLLDIVHPADQERISTYVGNAADPDSTVITDLECRLAVPDGRWRVLRMHAEVTTGSGGHRKFLGSVHDVTEQRALERQLAEHEALLSGAGKVTGVASWTWNVETEVIECSSALRDLLGLNPDSDGPVSIKQLNTVVHHHDLSMVSRRFRELAVPDGPRRADVECRVKQRSGPPRIVRVYAEVAADSNAEHRRLIGTVHDVTRLRELEREVSRDRVQLAEARKTARIGSWAWHVDSHQLELEPEAYDVFGLEFNQIESMDAGLERVHPDDVATLEAGMVAVLGTPGHHEMELRYRDGDDQYRTVRVYGERITDQKGDVWIVGNVHDLTRLRELEQAVEEGESRIQGLSHLMRVGSWEWHPDTNALLLSAQLREAWGLPTERESVTWKELISQVNEEDRTYARGLLDTLLRTGESVDFDIRFTDFHGQPHKMHVFAERKPDANGGERVLGTTYDLTEQWLAETRMERSVQRYADLVAASPMGIALVDDQERIVDVNDVLCELLDGPRERILGMRVTELAHPDGDICLYRSFLEYAESSHGQPRSFLVRKLDGSGVTCDVRTAASVQDDGRTFWVMMYTGVGEQTLESRAHGIDALTGLRNRAGIQSELHALLQRGSATKLVVLFCDVDNFARINDSLGHDFGDRVLLAMATRLREQLPEGCVAARHSGDEFVVICSDVRAAGGLEELAERISRLLSEPLELDEQQLRVSVSIGAAVPTGGLDTEVDLLRFADAAMFESKRQGSGSFSVAGAALIESMGSKLELESQLRAELDAEREESGLVLHFQSIVDSERRIVGAEALVRWNHPERGMLAPDKFLSIAAEADLLRDLDEWVLRNALEEASRWPGARTGDQGAVRVAINLSALLPGTDEFDTAVRDALNETNVDPRTVVLELVETSLVTLPDEGIEAMRRLVTEGVQFAVDDFGTGYSSLARLKDLPVQIIKVDRKFVSGVNHDTSDRAVVRAVVDLATAMGRSTVAEGVELGTQYEALRAEGVHGYQGWLFSKPVPAAQFRALISE